MKFIALLTTALLMGAVAFAQDNSAPVGGPELMLVQGIITGSIGYAIGLIVAFMGVYLFFYKQENFGIALILLGVLLTLSPGFYNGVRQVVCPIARSLAPEAVCK